MHLPQKLLSALKAYDQNWQRSRSSHELQQFIDNLHLRRELATVELDIDI